MFRLRFATSGTMTINPVGFIINRHIADPHVNVKTYLTGSSEITVIAKDMKEFTDFGIIELIPVPSVKEKYINVSIY